MVLDLHQKTYFLVTGASRGIGRMMALKMSAKLKTGSLIVLLSRSINDLAKTKNEIEALNNTLIVKTFCIDLASAKQENFEKLLKDSLDGTQPIEFERATIIHNAATPGDTSKRAIEEANIEVMTDYFHLNVFSAISLNCVFFKFFSAIPKIVVNISSMLAIEPVASLSFYSSSKAARDSYFKVLAKQEKHDTIVISYAPGAVDTDMIVAVEEETYNTELKLFYMERRAKDTMLTAEQTTEQFLRVLEEQKFESGDHVAYKY